MMTIDLVRRGPADNQTHYERNRAIFDQVPASLFTRPCVNSLSTSSLNSQFRFTQFVVSPVKPDVPPHWTDAMKGPYKQNWIAAAKVQFDKNKHAATYSLPFLRSKLPSNQKVIQGVPVKNGE